MIAEEMIDICIELFDLNFFKVDSEGYILWANENMLKASNIKDFSSIKGKHVEIFGKKVWESIKKVVTTGEKEIIEERVNNRYYRTEKRPIFQYSILTEVIGFSIDITKEKQENLAKEVWLENMRHDICTPLAAIIGCAELIKSESDPKKCEEYANDLIYSGKAFLNYHNKILEAVQVADGGVLFIKKKFNLIKEMELVIDINKPFATQKNIELTFKYNKDIPSYLLGDPIRVQRIVLELVTNALKFTEKGKVTLILQLVRQNPKESIIKIEVNDTGIGISPDHQKEIFCRFNHLSPSYKGIYKGAGLGLSIVKQFVDDLNGEIFIQSKEGEGTTLGCFISFQDALTVSSSGVHKPIPLMPEYLAQA